MKIFHCSDIHLGKRPFGNELFSTKRYNDYYKAFHQLADLAISNKVEVFMISGDLFDKRELSPDNLIKSEEIFEKLKNASIEVLIIEGNHDNSNKYDEINSWLHYLEEKNYAKRLTYKKNNETYEFIPYKIKDINFYGLGYPGFVVDKVIEALSKEIDPSQKNIVLVHTALGGGDNTLPGLVSTESLKLLQDKVLYIAGGHFHSKFLYPKEKPFFFIPGSPEYWNIVTEKSNEKGAFIFDTTDNSSNFLVIEPRKRIIETLEINDSLSALNAIEEFSKTLNLTGEELLILKIKISSNTYVNTALAEKLLEENGALKAYVLPVFLAEDSVSNIDKSTGTLIEIEESVVKTWDGIDSNIVSKYLQNLKEYQKNEEGSLFIESFDHMLEEMLNNEDK